MNSSHLSSDGESLVLTNDLRNGLVGIVVISGISFFSTTALFLYLTYKLLSWRFFLPGSADGQPPSETSNPNEQSQRGSRNNSITQIVQYALGIDGVFSNHKRTSKHFSPADGQNEQMAAAGGAMNGKGPNQFLILIFNLLLAEMHQSLAFFLNLIWIRDNEIVTGGGPCFMQGLTVSIGDLGASLFITIIALHTYLSVVYNIKVSSRVLMWVVISAWAFVYAISGIPIAATLNGAAAGGWFVRAGAWVSPESPPSPSSRSNNPILFHNSKADANI